jgi:hypothetical protein
VPFHFRVRSDVKIGQWRSFRSSAASIFQKRLRGRPSGGVGQRQPQKNGRINPLIQVGIGGEGRGQLGINNRIDEDRALSSGGEKFLLGPRQPKRVGRGNVQQDVGIERIIPRRG